MKIAHVVDSMEVGGAETLVLELCRLQRAQGHVPSVYAISKLGALGEQMLTEGFNVRANIGSHLTDSLIKLSRIFFDLRPDAVHLHNPTPTIYGSFAAKLAGSKAIISTRHSLVAPPHNHTMERKYAVAATCCDWVVGICDATTHNLRQLGRTPDWKIVRIYNGTGAVKLSANHPEKSGFTLLYVGRLEPVKNHDLLLAAFCKALSLDRSLRLWIVGDGTERIRLQNAAANLGIKDQVTFWGQQLDVARFFSAADTFIMSSVSEGLPMSLLQAFSIGVPAIVTDVGGMAEVVRMTRGGIVTPPGDVNAMANTILQMRTDPEARLSLSRFAADGFRDHFSLERMAEAYMQLYTGRYGRSTRLS